MTGRKDERLLSILPLSHMFEQMEGLLFPLRIGADVTYITSRCPKAIFKTMQERKVTVRFGARIMPPWESDSEKVTQLIEKSVAKLAS